MRTQGVKLLDPVLGMDQIDWLLVPAEQCRSPEDEKRIVGTFFRVPREPWGSDKGYVSSVAVRRSRRRILFYQHSGLIH
jgi:hypothetical protein